MRQRLCAFLVVLLLMFCGRIFSQENQQVMPGKTAFSKAYNCDIKKPVTTVIQQIILPYEIYSYKRSKLFTLNARPLSPSFYASQLGFVCKKELQFEKITSIPFRFRLGSLEYVNYLEQKPNAIKPFR